LLSFININPTIDRRSAKMALQDNQPLDIWVACLLLVVPMTVLALRMYIRTVNKTFGVDDALMAVGGFFYIFQCITVIGAAVAGIGVKNEHITGHAMYVAAGRWFFFNVITYSITACIVRLSVLVTLLRIAVHRAYKYCIYVAMVTITCIGLLGVLFLCAQCKPTSRYWDKKIPGTCASSRAIKANTIATTFVPAVTDVFSAVLPIILLWNIQMNIRSKFLVCIMLGLGVFAAICIVVRLPAIVDLGDHQDSLYSVSVSILWGTAEIGVAIAAASLSALRPLFRSWIGSTQGTNTHHTYTLGTMPGTKNRFHTSDGMERLPDPSGNQAWKGESTEVSDSMGGK
jgi:hypothetical protein